MKLSIKALITVVIAVVLATAFTGSASSATLDSTQIALSDSTSGVFSTTTTTYSDGTMISSASLDSSSLSIGGDGYPCGDVAYNAIQKWYDLFGIVLWTYKSHFGVHVCHNKVQKENALWDEPLSSTLGWSWCGNIVRSWGPMLPYSSAHSYTKGCFDVFYKIAETKYPWAKITIGGNGGLWARSTGVD